LEHERGVHHADASRRQSQRRFQYVVATGAKSEEQDVALIIGRACPSGVKNVVDREDRVHAGHRLPIAGRAVTESVDIDSDASKPVSREATGKLHPQAARPNTVLVSDTNEEAGGAGPTFIRCRLDPEESRRAQPDGTLAD
jgi:hypothetical protein